MFQKSPFLLGEFRTEPPEEMIRCGGVQVGFFDEVVEIKISKALF